jgi:hypothetical protein
MALALLVCVVSISTSEGPSITVEVEARGEGRRRRLRLLLLLGLLLLLLLLLGQLPPLLWLPAATCLLGRGTKAWALGGRTKQHATSIVDKVLGIMATAW